MENVENVRKKTERKRERVGLVNRDELGVIAKSIGKSDQAVCNERNQARVTEVDKKLERSVPGECCN